MNINEFSLFPLQLLQYDLKPNELKVLVALYSFRNKTADTVWPSLDSLAERACIKDPTTVSKVTSALCKKGLLEKKKRGFTGCNKYKLIIPDLELETVGDEGEKDPVKPSNLDETSKLGETTKSNLDETSKSNLDETSKYKEHTNEQKKEHTNTSSCEEVLPGDPISEWVKNNSGVNPYANPDLDQHARVEFEMHENFEPHVDENLIRLFAGMSITTAEIVERRVEYITATIINGGSRTHREWSRGFARSVMKFRNQPHGGKNHETSTRASNEKFDAFSQFAKAALEPEECID